MATEHVASVMVVDDDAEIRESISGVLEAAGYTVLTSPDGEDALARIERGERACVVLLDLMMPVMSGWEFMKAVGQRKELDDMPIVVVTAFSETAEEARRTLRKPLDVGRLLSAVAEFCCCPPRPTAPTN